MFPLHYTCVGLDILRLPRKRSVLPGILLGTKNYHDEELESRFSCSTVELPARKVGGAGIEPTSKSFNVDTQGIRDTNTLFTAPNTPGQLNTWASIEGVE